MKFRLFNFEYESKKIWYVIEFISVTQNVNSKFVNFIHVIQKTYLQLLLCQNK